MVTTRRGAAAQHEGEQPPSSEGEVKQAVKRSARKSAAEEPAAATTAAAAPPGGSKTRSSTPPAPAAAAAVVSPPKPKKAAAPVVAVQNEKKGFHYEFGGPLGAVGIVVGLPLVVLFLASASGDFLLPFAQIPDLVSSAVSTAPKDVESLLAWGSATAANLVAAVTAMWDPKWFAVYVAWFLFQVTLERVLPAEIHLGVPLARDGNKRLAYRVNGHLAFWVSLLVLGHGRPIFTSDGRLSSLTSFPLEEAFQNFDKLALASVVFSFVLSVYIYAMSFLPGRLLAEGGVSGNVAYDFFIGRELNPRIGSFDWKYFCELRPGLIGWAVLNLGMLKHKLTTPLAHDDSLWPILLVNLFQGWYVVDALIHEKAILTTMDITTDGFGFMLVFGDLAWVPFTYSLQAKYLAEHSSGLGGWVLVAVSALNVLGYVIFRQANSIKDQFRTDPSKVPHIKYLETKRGTRLMVSSWWGWARKINYTGDWLMGLAWCLLTGFSHLLPYFYAIYFAGLLVHRAARDDHACAIKYGEDWGRYKKAVPYRFIPFIY